MALHNKDAFNNTFRPIFSLKYINIQLNDKKNHFKETGPEGQRKSGQIWTDNR